MKNIKKADEWALHIKLKFCREQIHKITIPRSAGPLMIFKPLNLKSPI